MSSQQQRTKARHSPPVQLTARGSSGFGAWAGWAARASELWPRQSTGRTVRTWACSCFRARFTTARAAADSATHAGRVSIATRGTRLCSSSWVRAYGARPERERGRAGGRAAGRRGGGGAAPAPYRAVGGVGQRPRYERLPEVRWALERLAAEEPLGLAPRLRRRLARPGQRGRSRRVLLQRPVGRIRRLPPVLRPRPELSLPQPRPALSTPRARAPPQSRRTWHAAGSAPRAISRVPRRAHSKGGHALLPAPGGARPQGLLGSRSCGSA